MALIAIWLDLVNSDCATPPNHATSPTYQHIIATSNHPLKQVASSASSLSRFVHVGNTCKMHMPLRVGSSTQLRQDVIDAHYLCMNLRASSLSGNQPINISAAVSKTNTRHHSATQAKKAEKSYVCKNQGLPRTERHL